MKFEIERENLLLASFVDVVENAATDGNDVTGADLLSAENLTREVPTDLIWKISLYSSRCKEWLTCSKDNLLEVSKLDHYWVIRD